MKKREKGGILVSIHLECNEDLANVAKKLIDEEEKRCLRAWVKTRTIITPKP